MTVPCNITRKQINRSHWNSVIYLSTWAFGHAAQRYLKAMKWTNSQGEVIRNFRYVNCQLIGIEYSSLIYSCYTISVFSDERIVKGLGSALYCWAFRVQISRLQQGMDIEHMCIFISRPHCELPHHLIAGRWWWDIDLVFWYAHYLNWNLTENPESQGIVRSKL